MLYPILRRALPFWPLLLVAVLPVQNTIAAITGRIYGSILDPGGGAIAGASVRASNQATGAEATTISDALGNYVFAELPVGTWTITTSSPGFKTAVRESVVLLVDQQVRLDVKMELGETAETVKVEAVAAQVDTRSGTLSEVVTSSQIAELPLNGRNAQQLISLQAGVQITGRVYFYNAIVPQSVSFFSISGSPGNSTNYILDGGDHNDFWTNISMPTPNPDALQEFSVQTSNFTADYGGKAGGVVNMVVKAGTNSFHGTAFEFLRNYKLNARSFFAPLNDGLKRNQYGGTIGGPVRRDKTFFFFAYQGTNIRQRPSSLISVVPTAAQRAGDLSGLVPVKDPLNNLQPFPNNQIPKDRLDPTMQKFLERLIPLPNAPNSQLTYGQAVLRDAREFTARGDHSLGSRDKLFGSYFDQSDKGPNTGDPNNVLSLNFGINFYTRKITAGETHVFSPSLVNEARFSYGRTRSLQESAATIANNFTWQSIGMNIPRLVDTPAMLYFSSPLFGFYSGSQIDDPRTSYEWKDDISWIRGSHQMKFGADVIAYRFRDQENWEVDGRHVFGVNRTGSAYGDLLLGLPASYEQLNPSVIDAHRNLWMFYAQDTWRASRRLTLNYGLRYEPYLNWRSDQGEQAIFAPGRQSTVYPNLPPGLLVIGDAGVPKNGFHNLWSRLEPRLGFAFDPFGDGKTSLRGGYGVFYEVLSTVALSNFDTMQPFTTAATINEPFSFTDPYRGQVNPFPAPIPAPKTLPLARPLGTTYVFPANLHLPRIQQWNFTVERQLPASLVLRAAYVGSHGTNLIRNRDFNAARFIPGTDAQGRPMSTTGNVNSRRDYKDFQSIYISEGTGVSNLNSLLLTLERRLVRGFSFKINYTLQKSLDDAPQTAGAQHQNVIRNPLGVPDIYGPSDFDRTHRLVSNFIWQIPAPFGSHRAARAVLGGWELTGIATVQTGAPFTITSSGDQARVGGRTPSYADYVSGCDASARPAGIEPRLAWFNTSCFRDAVIGTFGNLGRNRLRGPAYKVLDTGVYRNFRIREQTSLQFRSEFFNILNHPNFGQPNASLSNPALFGTITSTSGGLYGEGPVSDPRVIQFALKLTF